MYFVYVYVPHDDADYSVEILSELTLIVYNRHSLCPSAWGHSNQGVGGY